MMAAVERLEGEVAQAEAELERARLSARTQQQEALGSKSREQEIKLNPLSQRTD